MANPADAYRTYSLPAFFALLTLRRQGAAQERAQKGMQLYTRKESVLIPIFIVEQSRTCQKSRFHTRKEGHDWYVSNRTNSKGRA